MLESTFSWGVMTAVWLIVGLFAVAPAAMSPMILDAPGSERDRAKVLLTHSTLVFPLVCLAAGVLPWILHQWPLAKWLFAIPLIHICMAILFALKIK